MAGQKLVSGFTDMGIPVLTIIENGNIEAGDEWALFRLTDDGLCAYYEIGCEVAACILGVKIKDEPAVKEVARFKTKKEAVEEKGKLSLEEQHRTLLRSVRPKCR